MIYYMGEASHFIGIQEVVPDHYDKCLSYLLSHLVSSVDHCLMFWPLEDNELVLHDSFSHAKEYVS